MGPFKELASYGITRRRFVAGASALLAYSASAQSLFAATGQAYVNPVMGGDHPDPSPLRVGSDFYLTHSSFDYAPGLLIWHSRDLVNWRPVATALPGYYGRIFAPYLCRYGERFYIYFPAGGVIHVVHAAHPAGPWSSPISLGIHLYDPAHIAEDGRRYLYLSNGDMGELTEDGLALKTPLHQSFDPWPLPADMRIECTCLEGPELMRHGEYFYLNVAEGGTAGPATSHSVISARSRHAYGPWEFSPYNPVVHTASRAERWLSMGHGRLVDTPDGRWYLMLHGYENGYRGLGRQLLLLPVEWTADGWWRLPANLDVAGPLPMPVHGAVQQPFFDPSDNFTSEKLGLQWAFWRAYDPARFTTGSGALTLQAAGKTLEDATILTTPAGDHSYTIEMDVEVSSGCESGLLLFYNPSFYAGLVLKSGGISVKVADGGLWGHLHPGTRRVTFRIVNDRQEVDFYYRLPGESWQRTENSTEVSSLNHNALGGFLDLRPAVYAAGQGHATFRDFRYVPRAVTAPAELGRDALIAPSSSH